MREWSPAVSVAFVVVSLLLLAVTPIVMLGRLNSMRNQSEATVGVARSLAGELRIGIAEEVADHLMIGDGRGTDPLAQYAATKAREQRLLDQLDTLAPHINPKVTRQLSTLHGMLERWHTLPDARASGKMTPAEFATALPQLGAPLDSLRRQLTQVQSALYDAWRVNRGKMAELALRQRILSATLGVLSLLAVVVVTWFGRRDRALTRELGRAVDEEVRLHAVAEARREALERLSESRNRLMRGFSHDVKNPIGAAAGYVQLIEDELLGPLTEQQRVGLGRARTSLRAALDLIADLLVMAKADADQISVNPTVMSVSATAREATEEYRAQAEAKGLAMTVDIRTDGLMIVSDPARVRQVLGNLVSNAVKYTRSGRIAVRVRAGPDAAGRPGVAFDVEDTGDGVPTQQQRRMFEEFVRLDPSAAPGSGIGLAISRRIVDALGGELTLRSEVGRGSTFMLWLPLDTGSLAKAVTSIARPFVPFAHQPPAERRESA